MKRGHNSWLGRRGISPETEHGWGTEASFDDANIGKYVDEFLMSNVKLRGAPK